MIKQKLTQLEWIILACFSGMALSSYLSVFVAQIISEFYGYDYMSQTSALLFLIVGSLNVLIVVQLVNLWLVLRKEPKKEEGVILSEILFRG
jgi:hypothetical protein